MVKELHYPSRPLRVLGVASSCAILSILGLNMNARSIGIAAVFVCAGFAYRLAQTRPFAALIVSVSMLFLGGGIAMLTYRLAHGLPDWGGDPVTAYVLISWVAGGILTAVFLDALLSGKARHWVHSTDSAVPYLHKTKRRPSQHFDLLSATVRLRRAALPIIAAAYFSAAWISLAAGGPPVLANAVDSARVAASDATGALVWMPFLALHVYLPLLGLLVAARRRQGIPVGKEVAIAIAAYLPLLLLGSRFYLLAPILLYFLLHHVAVKPWPLRRIAFAVIMLFAFLMIFIAWRIGAAGSWEAIQFAIAADLFGEMRYFVALGEKTSLPAVDVRESLLTTLRLGLVPGSVAQVIGIDKESLWVPIGQAVIAHFPHEVGRYLGLRMTLYGEVAAAFGLWPTAIVSGLMTFTALRVQNHAATIGPLTRVIIVGGLTLAIPYGTNFLLTTVQYVLLAHTLERFVLSGVVLTANSSRTASFNHAYS